jgi:hypothetical protein
VEIDYSAHHPRLAYSLAGARLDRNPYDVRGGLEDEPVKMGTVIAFNAVILGRQSLPWPATRESAAAYSTQVIEAIFELNELIKHLLRNDAGNHLMHLDNQIMMGVSTDLTNLGIPSIPIHDSVIVGCPFCWLGRRQNARKLGQVRWQTKCLFYQEKICSPSTWREHGGGPVRSYHPCCRLMGDGLGVLVGAPRTRHVSGTRSPKSRS